jgi:hypothetical protein
LNTTPHLKGTIMKTNNTKKTLKAAIAALGLAAVLSVPGCATAMGGGGGGGLTGGTGGGGLLGGILGALEPLGRRPAGPLTASGIQRSLALHPEILDDAPIRDQIHIYRTCNCDGINGVLLTLLGN